MPRDDSGLFQFVLPVDIHEPEMKTKPLHNDDEATIAIYSANNETMAQGGFGTPSRKRKERK